MKKCDANLRGDFFEANNNLCVERHSLTTNSSDGHNQRDETVKQRKTDDWEASIHLFCSGRSALRATLMRQARTSLKPKESAWRLAAIETCKKPLRLHSTLPRQFASLKSKVRGVQLSLGTT